jgi:hypothetical protein
MAGLRRRTTKKEPSGSFLRIVIDVPLEMKKAPGGACFLVLLDTYR